MPLSEHLPVCCGKYLQILISRTVYDDFSEVGHRSKFFRNGFHFHIAQFFPGNRADALCGNLSFRFLFHPVPQIGRVITEALVSGKLRLACRDQIISLTDIMDILPCKTASLRKERDHDLSVKTLFRSKFQRLSQGLCLHGPVAAQRGVSAADEDIIPSGLLRSGKDILRNGPVLFPALGSGEAPGICQDEEHPLLFPERTCDGLPVPFGIDTDIMDRLYPGGIVIQHDDDPPPVRWGLLKQCFRLRAWSLSFHQFLIGDRLFLLIDLSFFHFSLSASLNILSDCH